MKYQLYLILFLLFSVSACGPIKSTQSIIKADSAKQETLELISRAAEDASIIKRDVYNNESLNKKSKGEAAYFYFKGDLYLKKARELQAGALYEDSFKMADKAIEYFATASAMIAAANVQNSEPKPAETPQTDKNTTKQEEPAVIPAVSDTKPSESKENLPENQLKENNKTEEKDKKETPTAPVPVQTKTEPSPPNPEEVKPVPAVPEQKSNPETKPAEKKEEKSEKEVKEKKSEDPYADMYEKYKKMAEEAKKKKAKDAKEEKEEDKK